MEEKEKIGKEAVIKEEKPNPEAAPQPPRESPRPPKELTPEARELPPAPRKQPKTSIIVALIAGLSAIACTVIFSFMFFSYKTHQNGDISVTGSASYDFESDLAVWRGAFSSYGDTPSNAYKKIKSDADTVRQYLKDNGVAESEIEFSSVSISKRYVDDYNELGERIGEHLDGYDLRQSVTVTSNDLDKIDTVSRDITKLIESNIEFESYSPEYYYTKLDELKLDIIDKATENAKKRADIMTEKTGAKTKKLLSASLGVFQITAQNSDTEYTYGGAFDTYSRDKTASVTVRLTYSVD